MGSATLLSDGWPFEALDDPLVRTRPPRQRSRSKVPVGNGARNAVAAAAQRVVREAFTSFSGAARDDELHKRPDANPAVSARAT